MPQIPNLALRDTLQDALWDTIGAKIITDRNNYSGQLFGDRKCITVPEKLFPGIIWTGSRNLIGNGKPGR